MAELDLIVADDFAMLAAEQAGQPYVKAHHRARLSDVSMQFTSPIGCDGGRGTAPRRGRGGGGKLQAKRSKRLARRDSITRPGNSQIDLDAHLEAVGERTG